MHPECLSLLCDPETHDPFEFLGNALRNTVTGRVYALREGIPLFVSTLTGPNVRNQIMYDRLASGYDLVERLQRLFGRKPGYRLVYVEELEIAPGARVLEISVGTGANLPYLRPDVEFFGIDLSWGMLHQCARKVRKLGRRAELFECEAERLPFRNAAFDRVFHVGGISFFSDPSAAIREMIRVAKPGTKIVIGDETRRIAPDPVTEEFQQAGSAGMSCPVDLVPEEMEDVKAREIESGRFYCLTFRKPLQAGEQTARAALSTERQ